MSDKPKKPTVKKSPPTARKPRAKKVSEPKPVAPSTELIQTKAPSPFTPRYDVTADTTLQLMDMIALFGSSARVAMDACLKMLDDRPNENLTLGTFNTWILVYPKDAPVPKMAAVLAIEMASGMVFIDAYGKYGPALSAQQAFDSFKARSDKRKAEDAALYKALNSHSKQHELSDDEVAKRYARYDRVKKAFQHYSTITKVAVEELLDEVLHRHGFDGTKQKPGFYTHPMMDKLNDKTVFVDRWGCLYLLVEGCPEIQGMLDDLILMEGRPEHPTPSNPPQTDCVSLGSPSNIIAFKPKHKPTH